MTPNINIKNVIWFLVWVSVVAFVLCFVGALLALVTGHARWVELSWVSIAASLLGLFLSVAFD